MKMGRRNKILNKTNIVDCIVYYKINKVLKVISVKTIYFYLSEL